MNEKAGAEGSVRSDRSDRSSGRLRPSGGYRDLKSFQVATVIYDATVSFCQRFMDPRSRTVDQMTQAARSGRQNISEGSRASAVSSQTELRLVNVARASLDELLLDFEDYLRQRSHRQWGKEDPETRAVRAVGWNKDRTDPTDRSDPIVHWKLYARWLEDPRAEIVANTVLCLIHQANFLLDHQITALERQFVKEGGYTERLAAARLAQRQHQDSPQPTGPACPICTKPMALRTARKGPRAGSQFWGCSNYPSCNGTAPV